MKFLRKIKPSRVLRKRGEPGYHTHTIEGALVQVEPVKVQKRGGRRGEKVTEDHMILYATNAISFVRIDLGAPGKWDEPGPIPPQALRHMEQGVNFDLGLDRVKVGITQYERVFTSDLLPGVEPGEVESFPDFWKVVKKLGWKNEPTSSEKLTIDLDPRRLLATAEAIGCADGIKMTIDLRLARVYDGKVRKSRWLKGPIHIQQRDDGFYHETDADAFLMTMRPFGEESKS